MPQEDYHRSRVISIMIVEDTSHYREILASAIDPEPDMTVVGSFANVQAFLRELRTVKPDLVMMDIQLPGMSGIEGVWKAREIHPDLDILMCTVFQDDDNIFQSLQAGACGYILKSTPLEEIIEAVREVVQGGAPMSPSIARRVLGAFKKDPKRRDPSSDEPLTVREREILYHLAEGKSYPSIAGELFISHGTVQSHVKNIYRKLQVHSKAEIIAWIAREHPSRY